MLPPKRISGFICRLLVFYLLLAAPWPGLNDAYARLYCAAANVMFGSVGSGLIVQFKPLPEPQGDMDVEIDMRQVGSSRGLRAPHNVRSAYLSTAEVIALILATPIPWSRRWKALVWGLVCVNLLVVLRMAVIMLEGLLAHPAWTVISLGPTGTKILSTAAGVLAVSPMLLFVLPVLIWVLVTFRRGDFAMLVGETSEKVRADGP